MRKRVGGFTIVELMVTIAVLVILTTLVATRLRNTQAAGRDQERATDATTIVTGLEIYYENGSVQAHIPKGYYPGATEINAAAAQTPPFKEFLDGVSAASLTAPERTIDDSFGINPNYLLAAPGADTDGSYSDLQARTLLDQFPYLYQPLKRDNTFCVDYVDCAKFNFYYLEEVTNQVIKIRSKNQ